MVLVVERLPVNALRLKAALVALALLALAPDSASAQTNNTGTNNTGGGVNTGNTNNQNPFAGVVIDADGVLRRRILGDAPGNLNRRRSARAQLGADGGSPLRKVSLNRLEAALAKAIEAGGRATDEMNCLAGLLRVKYVFYYPESKDIVLAGPAEPWDVNAEGRLCGIRSGRPVVELQDLVVALRTFAPGSNHSPQISCSIDPTSEGLARMQEFLRSVGSTAVPSQTQYIVEGLRTSLGLQNVSIGGVPANTHFAHVLLEADYRMKLIGIGLERPPVRLASYVSQANPATVSRNALQRWWFVPEYQCVRVSGDKLSMELVGDGVKLVGEDEVVGHDGHRRQTGGASRASQAFVTGFTKAYPGLAARAPIYAQLRNVIDLSVAAAFIRQQDYYGQSGWRLGVLGDEARYPVETLNTPKQVETAVASLWKNKRLMTPVGGGVEISADKALLPANLLADEKGEAAKARASGVPNLAEGQWWWD
jgi:hypothetical protein